MNFASLDSPRQSLLVDAALALEGLSYGDKTKRSRYIANLYPYDAPQVADQMASGQESCGLTCEAILRAVGVDGTISAHRRVNGTIVAVREDLLRVPYALRWCVPPREGEYGLGAVSYQLELARQQGALWGCPRTVAEALDLCEPGAMVQLEGPAHVLTVIRRLPDGTLETVEGGQLDGGNGGRCTAILRLRREFVPDVRQAQLRTAGSRGPGRRVVSILRAWELPLRTALLIPGGGVNLGASAPLDPQERHHGQEKEGQGEGLLAHLARGAPYLPVGALLFLGPRSRALPPGTTVPILVPTRPPKATFVTQHLSF